MANVLVPALARPTVIVLLVNYISQIVVLAGWLTSGAMITARASAADQFNGMAAGPSAYLIKPFHPGDLRDDVSRLCPARSST